MICFVFFFFWVCVFVVFFFFFFFNDTATTEIYTLSLHDALPISGARCSSARGGAGAHPWESRRSEEHTSELQSLRHLVCRLLLEKKKKKNTPFYLNQKKKKTKNCRQKHT